MQRIAAFFRRFAWVPSTLLCWLMLVGTVLAEEETKAAPKSNNWTLAYILVLLGIALGLIVVCRPGRRAKDLPGPGE